MDSSGFGARFRTQRLRRMLLAAAMALVAVVFALQTTQAAAPQQPAVPCNEPGTGTEVAPADGLLRVNMFNGAVLENLVASIHKITLDSGGILYGYCIDALRPRNEGAPSCLYADLSDVRLVYLITKYPPDLNNTINHSARQAAVWHFASNFNLDLSNATSSPNPVVDQAVANLYSAIVAEVAAIDPANPPAILQPGPLGLTITPSTTSNTLPGQQDSPFVVRLTKNGQPLAGYTVAVTTDFGTLNQPNATTNANGEASFVVSSSISGTANLSATASVSIPSVLEYVDQGNIGRWQPYGMPTSRTEIVGATGSASWTQPPPSTGAITLTKSVTGWTQPWSFGFTLNGDLRTATNATPTVSWTGLNPGQSYTLIEVPSGDANWSAGPIACAVGGVPLPDAEASTPGYQIVVQAGVTVACTALNTYTPPPGAITLTKSVTGWTQPWSFGFTLNSDLRTATNTTPTVSWTGLTPGQSYTLVEVPSGDANWSAGPIACSVDSVSVPDADASTPGFQIVVQPGVTVACTALNTYTPPATGAITLTKSVTGWTQPWSFGFTLNGDLRNATNATPTVSWTGLTPGQSYTLVEVPSGDANWSAGPIACFVGTAALPDADAGTPGYQIVVQPGVTIGCTVLNTYTPPPPGAITLTKSVTGWTQPWSFGFTLDGDLRTATNTTPTVSWTGLTPGQSYTLVEVPTSIAGWTAGPLVCFLGEQQLADADLGTPGYQIVVQSGATVACSMLNTYTPPPPDTGNIQLTKAVSGWTQPWSFGFTLDGNLRTASNITPTVSWTGLTPGQSYTLVEVAPSSTDWSAGPITCAIGGDPIADADAAMPGFQIVVRAGVTVACSAVNTYTPPPPTPGRITVTKVVTSTRETSWTFFFRLNGGPFKAATTASPTVSWENLAANQTYILTEADPGSTWEEGSFVCKIGETTVGERVNGGGIQITLASGADVRCIKYNYQVTGTGLDPEPEPSAGSWLFLPNITR